MNKRDLARSVKLNAAALIEAMDLGELLGEDVFEEIIDDPSLQDFAAAKQLALAKIIRKL